MDRDLQLLEAWRAGDAQSGTLLFERHFSSVYRFFRNKIGDDAEDLVQQTFLACVQTKDRFRGDSSFRTYLFKAARSKLYTYLSKRQRQRDKIDFGVTSVVDLGMTMNRMLVRNEQHKHLLHALRMIPLDLQIILELHYFEGLRGPALADVLEIPEGTVRSRLRRGREQLRKQLERLHRSPAVAESTMTNLEDWAKDIRDGVLGKGS